MGSSQSSTVRVLNQSLTTNLNNIVKNNMMEQNTVQINRNTFDVQVGGSILYCAISNDQRIDTSQIQQAIQKVDNTTELISKLNEAMDATARSQQTATNGFLSTTFGAQKSRTEAMNIMKSIVQNNITEENVQQLNAVIDNANNFKLRVGGDLICDKVTGKIENIQGIRTNQVAGALQDILTKTLAKNEKVAKAIGKSEGKQDIENKGVASLLGPWFFMIAIIVIAFIVGGVFLFKSLLSSPEAMDIVKSRVGGPKPF